MSIYLTQTKMEKRKIEKIVYRGICDVEPNIATLNEITKKFLPTDIPRVTFLGEQEEEELGGKYYIEMVRYEEETEEDYNERVKVILERQEMAKKYRERLYNQLKEEFEPKTSGL